MRTKICSKCKIKKPFSEYFKDNLRQIGIRYKCKVCCKNETIEWRIKNRLEYNNYIATWRAKNPEKQHAIEIKRHYKLSLQRYNEILVDQDMKCKICSKPHDPSKKRGRLYVDRCYHSKFIRGLLCNACNLAINYFNHDIDILQRATAYLSFLLIRP